MSEPSPCSNEEHLKSRGAACPWCRSASLKAGRIEVDGDSAWQPVTCESCGKSWTDDYRLSGFTPDE